MAKKALIVWGGWDGHHPKECAELFAQLMPRRGFAVDVANTLDAYLDEAKMAGYDLIVPMWTMGQISGDQESGLLKAIENGAGIAGFHGGMCDSFRNNCTYQMMTGGQFVSHPLGCVPEYTIHLTNREHEITRGIKDFKVLNSERYYMHVDPSNNVLGTLTFDELGVVMPAVWTRSWGKGRVFYASHGHTEKDFDVPEAREIVLRGMEWACR